MGKEGSGDQAARRARALLLFGQLREALPGLGHDVDQARSQDGPEILEGLAGGAGNGVAVLQRKGEHAESFGQVRLMAQKVLRQGGAPPGGEFFALRLADLQEAFPCRLLGHGLLDAEDHAQAPEVCREILGAVRRPEDAVHMILEAFPRLGPVALGRLGAPLQEALLDHGGEQQVLALEMPVDAAYGQRCIGRNLGHGRTAIAVLGYDVESRLENSGPDRGARLVLARLTGTFA
jgi:hypothetical protein